MKKTIESMNLVEEDPDFPLDFNIISKHQFNNTYIQKRLKKNPMMDKRFVNNVPLIFFNNKVVLPPSILQPVVSWYHDNLNHPGICRTFETININFAAKCLCCLVEKYVLSCPICLKHKNPSKKYDHLPPSTSTLGNVSTLISLLVLGPLNVSMALLIN